MEEFSFNSFAFYLQSIKHMKCLKARQLHTQRKIIIVLIDIVSYNAVKPYSGNY